MWVRPADIEQAFEQLGRVFEAPVFQFVLLQVLPEYEIKSDVEHFIKKQFPDRPIANINLRRTNYAQMMQQLDEATEGFVFLQNFEYLLQSPELYIGFNQRRDRIASKPVTLVALTPSGTDMLRLIEDRIPDFWSLRTFVLEIRYRYVPEIKSYFQPRFLFPEPDPQSLEERISRLAETKRRLSRVIEAGDNTEALILLYRELALICKTLAQTTDAKKYIEKGIRAAQKQAGIASSYDIAHFQVLQCRILVEQGYKNEARSMLESLEESIKPLEDRELRDDLHQLRGEWMLEHAPPEEAQSYFENLLALSEKAPFGSQWPILQTLYAMNWMRSGQWDRAFYILEDVVQHNHANAVSYYAQQVIVSTRGAAEVLRKFGDAIIMLKGAGFTVKSDMSEKEGAYPFFQLFLGSSWFFKGLSTEFGEHFTRAFRVLKDRYGTQHPFTADALYYWAQYLLFVKGPYPGEAFIPNLGLERDFYHWKKSHKANQIVAALRDALQKFEEAQAIFQNYCAPQHKKTIQCEVFIAFVHLHLGNHQIALAHFERIVQNDSPIVKGDDYLMGVCYFGLGKTQEYLYDRSAASNTYAKMAQRMATFTGYSLLEFSEARNALFVAFSSLKEPPYRNRLISFFRRLFAGLK